MDVQQTNIGMQRPVPNSTGVLVLGILSIVLCCCYGIVGLICAIIALVLYKTGIQAYRENPAAYTPASLNNLNAGRICAIIGVVFSCIYLAYIVWLISTVGLSSLNDPEQVQEKLREIFGK